MTSWPPPQSTVPSQLLDEAAQNVAAVYARHGMDTWSDAVLAGLVGDVIARPLPQWHSSFVMHAPMEFLARLTLLPLVEPAARSLARKRLLWMGMTYRAAGPSLAPRPPRGDGDAAATRRALMLAVTAGDVERSDELLTGLACQLGPEALCAALADLLIPRLTAAAHGTIALSLLPRVVGLGSAGPLLLRGILRDAAASPAARFRWFESLPVEGATSADLGARLEAVVKTTYQGGESIGAMMTGVETSGLAAEVLPAAVRGCAPEAAECTLLRVAAWSMIQDDPAKAPYGWSHCVTLPQAVLRLRPYIQDQRTPVLVAATMVLASRAALGRVTLDPQRAIAPSTGDALAALAGTPDDAVRAVWHAPAALVPQLITRLVSFAATHADAHLVKYTLACLDACASDPQAERLYLAAAASLGAWWRHHPVAGDVDLR